MTKEQADAKNAELTAKLAEVLGTKPKYILTRLKALDMADYCSRCGGGGSYSYCRTHGTTCFKCGGSGVQMPRITQKLVDMVDTAVKSGKMQPYLDQLERNVRAKKLAATLLDDYGSLTAHEKDRTIADGRRGWMIGTIAGYAIRSAASRFYQAAKDCELAFQYGKTDEERNTAAARMEAFHKAMMESPVTCVPEMTDSERDEVIDTFKLSPEQKARHEELDQTAMRNAWELLAKMKAELGMDK